MRPIIHAASPQAIVPVMASMLLNGWALRAGVTTAGALVREGGAVTWALPSLALTGAAATSSLILTLPPGYRVGTSGNYGAVGWLDGEAGPVRLQKDFDSLSCSARTLISGVVSWPTLNPWPT